MGEEVIENEGHSRSRWYSWDWLKWCPTSDELLQAAEARILKRLNIPYKGQYVTALGQEKIWTVTFNPERKKTPLLLLHGFGSGTGMWCLNYEGLSKDRPVIAMDHLGFARSSRPNFGHDPNAIEETFVNAVEDMRKGLGLDKFVLLGHSFGAYVAYSYALKHPDRVEYLILADPWGFSAKPADWEKTVQIPTWVKVMATVLGPFNPFAALRVAGPIGPSILPRYRPDLQRMYSRLFDDNTFLDYLYHCNAQKPSAEIGFKNMTVPYGWAKNPMVHRMREIQRHIKISMIFGEKSWIDHTITEEIAAEMPDQFHVHTFKNCGHHVYASEQFNEIVNQVCESIDKENSKDQDIELIVE